jgi:post-segregation antitoxin (ccd killing protein)
MLRLPLFALVFSLANAALLATRIRVENQALDWARQAEQGISALTAATLANETPRR